MSEDSTTQRLKALAPGLAWMPRAARDYLSPKAVWSAIVIVFSAGIIVALFQARLSQIERDVASSRELVTTMSLVNTRLEVLQNDVGHIKDEVDDQKRWREHVECLAEQSAHNHNVKC